MVPGEPDAELTASADDPLRGATPPADDVEARRARASVEARLFGDAQAPVTVGRYHIKGRIGQGGMGVVYRAHDPELARDVAVKLLNPEASGADAQTASARLVREARAMARLAHPNVIHVYDVGTVSDGVFVAMELVEGTDLASWLAAQPRSWLDVLRKCTDAGAGLAAAHAAGVIHRDFKPENVLVGNDGRVRVVDFGLAGGVTNIADLDSGETPIAEASNADETLAGSLTKTGMMLGTPKYMAPEQYAGGTSNARSDQFSFCVTLFEALYGFAPFSGDTVRDYRRSVQHQRVADPPPESEVEPWIRGLIVRGLALDPAQRHPGLEPLLDQLRAPLRGAPRPRRRWLLPAAATAGLAVAAGLLWASTAGPPSAQPAPPDHQVVAPRVPKRDDPAPPKDTAKTAGDAKHVEPTPVGDPQAAQPDPPKLTAAQYDEYCYVHEDNLKLLRKTASKPRDHRIRDAGSRCLACRNPVNQRPRGVSEKECRAWYRCARVPDTECSD